MKEKEVFGIFQSPALINGERVMIGIDEAEAIKGEVVSRGLCFESEDPEEMHWMENIISSFRESTTQPDFDHEYWGAWTLMPNWARRVVSISIGGWIDFPPNPSELNSTSLGEKVGYFLTISEMRLQGVLDDEEFLKGVEKYEWLRAVRGLEKEDAEKVTVESPGFNDMTQYASESKVGMTMLKTMLLGLVGTQDMQTCCTFFKAFALGSQRARKVDVISELSDFNLRQDVIEQLYRGWDYVATLKTRVEIAEFVLSKLPDSKREYFKADESLWESFRTGVLRDLFREIGLNPASKGRPRKNGAHDKK